MELLDESKQVKNNIYQTIFSTRLKEYIQPLRQPFEKSKLKKDNNKKIDIICISIVSITVLLSGIFMMSVLKVGVPLTFVICIFVLALLILGYLGFVKPTAISLANDLF